MDPLKVSPTQETKLHFLDYWRIIRIRKTVILAVFLLVVITATLVTFILPESFSSTVRIKIEHDQPDVAGMVERGNMNAYDPYYLQTEFEQNVILLKDAPARLLTEGRGGGTLKKGSDSPAVHWSVVKTFFKGAFSTDLIPADPSAKLKSLPSGRHQVLPLSRDDFDRIQTAVDQCGFTP